MDKAPVTNPFVVAIDSAETHPFSFEGLFADAKQDYAPLIVPVQWMPLGRYPASKGDYSILGMTNRIGIERKSVDDAWGTVLGWETDYEKQENLTPRRERFKSELANLADLDAALVVVEGSWQYCCTHVPQWGEKDGDLNCKIFFRSCLSMMQDFHVPWIFCDTRRMAEVTAFRYLQQFWRKHHKEIESEEE